MAKAGNPGRDLHLHVDAAGLDALKGYGGNPLDHAAPLAAIEGSGTRGESKNIRGTKRGGIEGAKAKSQEEGGEWGGGGSREKEGIKFSGEPTTNRGDSIFVWRPMGGVAKENNCIPTAAANNRPNVASNSPQYALTLHYQVQVVSMACP